MPDTQYKVGICTDGKRHAVVRRFFQHNARCGAGRIVLKVEGRFAPDDLLACPKCATLVRAEEDAAG